MKRVLTAVVLIPLVLGTVLWDSFAAFAAITGLVAALCLVEYLKLIRPLTSWTPKYLATTLLIAYFLWIAIYHRQSSNPKVEWDVFDWAFDFVLVLLLVPLVLSFRIVFTKDPRDFVFG